MTPDEARRAHAAFVFEPGAGEPISGEGETVVGDDAITVGAVQAV